MNAGITVQMAVTGTAAIECAKPLRTLLSGCLF